MNMYFINI